MNKRKIYNKILKYTGKECPVCYGSYSPPVHVLNCANCNAYGKVFDLKYTVKRIFKSA